MKQLFMDVFLFWKETWNTNKTLFWIEAVSTLLGMTASTIMNLHPKDPNMWAVLICYFISAIGLTYGSYKRRSSFMMLLMLFYSVTTGYGLIGLMT